MSESMTDLERCARAATSELAQQTDGADAEDMNAVTLCNSGPLDMYVITRAVLECLKTPSEGMVEAGRQGDGLTYLPKVIERQWTAMINYILKGE